MIKELKIDLLLTEKEHKSFSKIKHVHKANIVGVKYTDRIEIIKNRYSGNYPIFTKEYFPELFL